MGDMADWLIEQGEDEWFAHLANDCGQYGPCQYCEEPKLKRRPVKKGVRKEHPHGRIDA